MQFSLSASRQQASTPNWRPTLIDPRLFEVDSSVDKVMHVQEPYKLANRAFHPEDSVIDVSGVKIGGGHMGLIAGPCSVESFEQVLEIAKAAKASGANLLRGGAFKPRTSPYSFQGLGLEGLDILCKVKDVVPGVANSPRPYIE